MELKGKTALVTGGTHRIGAVIAKILAEKGARVAAHYHRSAPKTTAVNVTPFQADLSQIKELQKLVEDIEQRLGPIQILINNAAIFEQIPFFEISEADFDRHLNINLKAPFLLSQKIGRNMLEQKEGKIINIADYTYLKPYHGYLAYSVSKAGLIGLTKCLAKELAPDIQVNAIALGLMLPPKNFSEEQKKWNAEKTLLKRWGDPKEIANAVCFLLEGTDYATGSVLEIDGGRLLA